MNKFKLILQCLHFDDVHKRADSEKLEASSLVDSFNINCKKHYSLSGTVPIEEMLDTF